MLGCQDFCGYYDWTFHAVRRRWGQEAVRQLWAKAIGGESQQHYADCALRDGLRGLYRQWVKTGEEESCDWTFTLDEAKNLLRLDMRECPSKGFLVNHDLNADEDYCDHCMGWVIPLLSRVGVELVEHEHNHCGQCWQIMRMKDRPAGQLELDLDIRRDPRWGRGYVHRWEYDRPQPLMASISPSSDPAEVLDSWLRDTQAARLARKGAVLVSDIRYNDRLQCPADPAGVLVGCAPADPVATAARYAETAPAKRPLLLHPFLPGIPFVDFPAVGLPRPLPILPLLIRRGVYTHRPGGPHPTSEEFVAMLTTNS
jgi:hypothetical protein